MKIFVEYEDRYSHYGIPGAQTARKEWIFTDEDSGQCPHPDAIRAELPDDVFHELRAAQHRLYIAEWNFTQAAKKAGYTWEWLKLYN